MNLRNIADATITLDPGSKLFVYSDGCYEVFQMPRRNMMTLEQFAQALASRFAGRRRASTMW